MTMRPNILIGTPCYGGLVSHVYLHSMLQLMAHAAANDIGLGLWTAANDSLVTRSRNSIVSTFLDSPSATHLMFIDADTGFEPAEFQRLVNLDEDVAAAMYPIKNLDWEKTRASLGTEAAKDDIHESGLHYVGVPCSGPDRRERDGFVTAQYAGTGFMLIRRAVIDKLTRAYPETKFRHIQTYPRLDVESDNQYSIFDCMIEPETKTFLSEDFTFCHRWRQIGGTVWLDTQARLKHVGSYVYQGTPALLIP